MDHLLEDRRGSIDSSRVGKRKNPLSFAQKFNLFTKGSKSGTQSPVENPDLNRLKGNERRRSNSLDAGVGLVSPLYNPNSSKMMFLRRDEDLIEGVSTDFEAEVQLLTGRKMTLINPPTETTEYTTVASDTLANIAARHKSTTSELIKINRLMSPLVFPGQRLFVPTEDYHPIGYGSQNTSPSTSRSNSEQVDSSDEIMNRIKSITLSDSEDKKKKEKEKKAKKNKSKDRKTDEKRIKRRVLFRAAVNYMTGEENSKVTGILEISKNEVEFEPDMKDDEEGLLQNIVRYRMALGKAMITANFVDKNPFGEKEEESERRELVDGLDSAADGGNEVAKTQEEGTEEATDEALLKKQKVKEIGRVAIEILQTEKTDEGEKSDDAVQPEAASCQSNGESSSNVKYLCVKMGIPSKAIKERPTISNLIKTWLPPSVDSDTVDHCFEVPEDIVAELQIILELNFPDVYGKTAIETADRFDAVDKTIKRSTGAPNKKRLRRTLSVAELCNLPLPPMSHESQIVEEIQMRILLEHLLPVADGRPWNLVYSSDRHGFSIRTLYRSMIQTDLATLLLIQDLQEKVFGAMLPCSIRMSEGFYGTGETFLFTFHPIFKKFCWSGKNSYFLKGNFESFSIGASDGVFGLWFYDDLSHGITQRCDTFENDPLTGAEQDFYIKCFEVWQFPFSLE